MPDYHVDARTGNDGNPGTPGSPVRTITRATQLAAAAGDSASGTIHVNDGAYSADFGERFPLLVPPSFALEGETRAGTIIRFTGESRSTEVDGHTVTFWGGTALQAGAAVRHLTIEVDPQPAGFTCIGTVGIDAQEDRTSIEDVTMRARSPESLGFGWDAVVTHLARGSSVSRMSSEGSGGLHAATGRIFDCDFDYLSGGATVVGDALIEDCRFAGSPVVTTASSTAMIRRNEIGHMRIWSSPPTGAGPTVAHNRILDGLTMRDGFGAATIEDNRIFGGIFIMLNAGSPIIRRNTVVADYYSVLFVRPGATPLVEENIFGKLPSVYPGLRLLGRADLGGGVHGSRGLNHFGPISQEGPLVAVGVIAEGLTVHGENNYWRNGLPVVDTSYGGHMVTDGAMVDPITDVPEI